MGKFIDLTGKKFNMLTVMKRVENKGKQPCWLCLCDCGNETIVTGDRIRSGGTKTCGCLQKEKSKLIGERSKTHQASKTRLYETWTNLKTRCNNPNTKNYKDYGGRGITVFQDWNDSFECFKNWAITNGYEDTLTLDRIDNSKGYYPNNCRWATKKTQANNKRNNHFIAYRGEIKTLAQWCRELNLRYDTIERRINKGGWSIERAFETPIRGVV